MSILLLAAFVMMVLLGSTNDDKEKSDILKCFAIGCCIPLAFIAWLLICF